MRIASGTAKTLLDPDEHTDGLQGVPHNIFRLVVALGLLMQQFDPGHLLAAFGSLDAVSHQNASAVDTERIGE
jgi:hypothetical protein